MLSAAPARAEKTPQMGYRDVAHARNADAHRVRRFRRLAHGAYLQAKSGAIEDEETDRHEGESDIDQQVMAEEDLAQPGQIGEHRQADIRKAGNRARRADELFIEQFGDAQAEEVDADAADALLRFQGYADEGGGHAHRGAPTSPAASKPSSRLFVS